MVAREALQNIDQDKWFYFETGKGGGKYGLLIDLLNYSKEDNKNCIW